MAPSSFHAFARLPCELRLHIWQLALRPRHAGGLHHFFLDGEGNKDSMDPSLYVGVDGQPGGSISARRDVVLNIGRLQSNSSVMPGKGSVYYWDAGLWTACRESRHVIERRSKSDREHKTEHYSLLRRERIGCRRPAFATVRQGGTAWNLMVQPHRDLFCFHVQGWDTGFILPHPSTLRAFEHPVCGRRGLGPEDAQRTSVQHFALEFDARWNENWPGSPDELMREASPRGFIARLILRAVLTEVGFFIWLIDRGAPVPKGPLLEDTRGQVFYDMDAEYVEVPQWSAGESSYFIDNISLSLGDWYQFRGEDVPHVGDSFELSWSFGTEAYIGILKRREKD